MADRLIDFTFSSGVKVKIRKLSPFLLQEFSKNFPEPEPPVEEVKLFDGTISNEPNTNNPDYQRELSAWAEEQEVRTRTYLMKKAVVYDLTAEDLAELEALRKEYREDYKIELPEKDDKVAFLTYVAVSDAKDITNLIEKIVGRVQPTEASIQKAQSEFQRPIRK